MDKKKIVSFHSELFSLYMNSPKNYCFVNQHGCMLCRVIEKNSNMLRLGIFGLLSYCLGCTLMFTQKAILCILYFIYVTKNEQTYQQHQGFSR